MPMQQPDAANSGKVPASVVQLALPPSYAHFTISLRLALPRLPRPSHT